MLLTHLVLGALAIISPASTYPTQTNRDPKYENAYPHISSAGGSIGSDPQLQPLIALEHFKRSVEAFFGSIAPEPHPTSADAGLAARDITTSRGPVKKRGQSAQAPANGGRKPAAPAVVKSSKSLAAKPPNAAALPKAATAPKAATLPKAATAPKAATVPKAAALPKAAAVPKGKNVAAAGTNKGSPGCLRKGLAKRTVVETSVNIDDTAMKNMIAVARRSDNSWRDGEGWAILAGKIFLLLFEQWTFLHVLRLTSTCSLAAHRRHARARTLSAHRRLCKDHQHRQRGKGLVRPGCQENNDQQPTVAGLRLRHPRAE